jgi:glucan phosphoethanolaminetransferase (alkaline phosphatase superfamily)
MTTDPKKAERQFAMISLVGLLAAFLAGKSALLSMSAVGAIASVNVLLYGLTLFLFRRTQKSFFDPNPQKSIRAIMSGFMIKFFILATVALLYILYWRKEVSIPALLWAAALYVIYTAAEIRALLISLKQSDHA